MTKEKSNLKQNIKTTGLSRGIRFFLSVVIILGLGYVILNYVPFIAKYDYYVIATDSMEPVIMTRDVVIIDTSVDVEDLEEDQIIAFYADIRDNGTEEVVVHYLDSITEVDGERTYRTYSEKGQGVLDEWTLTDEDIVGIHKLSISYIGGFILFSQSLIGKIVLIADILIIYLLIEVFTESKDKKDKKEKKEEEKETTSE